jgi:rhodanese-related sulfurtransferase
MRHLSPSELRELLDRESVQLVDVRTLEEWENAHLQRSLHIPMDQVADRLAEIDRAQPVVVVCLHGIRSERVARFLEREGFAEVGHLVGGLERWASEIDPSLTRY